MKNKTNILKAGIAIAVALFFIGSGITVFANGLDRWEMIIEDTSATTGTEGHIVPINGFWSESILGYQIKVYYDQSMVEVVDVNVDGCVGQGGILTGELTDTYFLASLEKDIVAGNGQLFNLVVDVIGDPGVTEFIFEDYIRYTHYKYLYPGGWHTADLTDGTLEILNPNSPPEEPEIDGPTEGYVDKEYTFTIVAEDPDEDNLTYEVNWGDETESFGPFESGEEFEASHTWAMADTYTIEVIASDGLEDSPVGTHTIVIEEEPDEPELEITIESGLRVDVRAIIKNTGNATATEVKWSIKVIGGIFDMIDHETTGIISKLAAGEEKTIITEGFIIGFGPIDIIAATECAEGAFDEATADGFQIFIFTIVR